MKDLEAFARLVEAESGIVFAEKGKAHLLRALKRRMSEGGVENLSDYYRRLTNPADGAREMRELLSLAAISETGFFRHPEQFETLRDYLRARSSGSRRSRGGARDVVRIWSACCSSGEEPYSIAMVLAEMGEAMGSLSFDLYATDVNYRALAKARGARYSASAVSRVPSRYRGYFLRDGDGYRVRKDSLETVRFSELNLVRDPYPCAPLSDLDLIFCRNTFIYFSRRSIGQILEKFSACLKDDGYLVLAPTELAFLDENHFVSEKMGGVFYCRKRGSAVRRLRRWPPDERPRPDSSDDPCTASNEPCDSALDSQDLKPVLREARGFADEGLYDKTIEICRKILCRFSTSPEAYFILGLAHWEKSDRDGAMSSFRKAIYLEPRFALAHFYLGNVCWHAGLTSEAARRYRNVIDCFERDAYCGILPEIMDVIPEKELRRICGEYLTACAGRASKI